MKTHGPETVLELPKPSLEHPSDYAILSYVREELTGNQKKRVLSHLSSCETCQKRVEEIPAHRSAFLYENSFEDLWSKRPDPPSKIARWQKWLGFPSETGSLSKVPAFAMVALLLGIGTLLWYYTQRPMEDNIVSPNNTRTHLTDNGTKLKGTNVLWVVKRGGEQLIAEPTFAFKGGDQIGFTVLSSFTLHALLLLVHDDGQVEILFPTKRQMTENLVPAKKETTLPLSLSLESPIELQRIFLILTPNEPVIAELVEIAEKEYKTLKKEGKGIAYMDSLSVDAIVETRLIEPR